ncbi:putative BPI/LBP family protein [Iris pallida]|nr:putative BPI/LBP family protein [Iris pallida]
MAVLVLLFFLAIFSFSSTAQSQHSDSAFISAIISAKGLDFVKDILVEQELKALTPLRLPDINKSIRIPLVGAVEVSVSNITLSSVDVSSSVIRPGDTGIMIAVSGATANLSLDWEYTYSTWLIPIDIADNGGAFIEVQGMEVGLTMTMKNNNGTLELNVTECGCYMEDIFITLNGGASWLYQGFVYAFEDQIRAAVEKAITKKITEGTSKLDSLLQSLPKKIDVDHNVALDVTFVDDPLFGNSSIEFDINGLFVPSENAALSSYLNDNSKLSDSCLGTSNMLGISLDEAVFNSASVVYFQEG